MRYTIIFLFILSLLLAAPVGATQLNTSGRCPGSGNCEVGDTNTDSIQLTTDGAIFSIGVTANAAILTATTTGSATFIGADAAGLANTIFTTTGAGTVTIGTDGSTTSVTIATDGVTLGIDTAAASLTLEALTTATATFIGADAASPANTAFTTTGAGAVTVGTNGTTLTVTLATDGVNAVVDDNTFLLTATGANVALFKGADSTGASITQLDATDNGSIVIGSGDLTGVTVVTSGGTATIDGYVQADVGPFISLASGALTANNIHLATAAADYVMPACEAANLGEWVTVVVRDISEVVVLQPASGDTLHPAGAVIDQNHEMDSAGAATSDGDFVTLVCITADNWYSTAIGGAWVDGGAS